MVNWALSGFRQEKRNRRHVFSGVKSQDYANIHLAAIFHMKRFLLTTLCWAGLATPLAAEEVMLSPEQLRADFTQLYEGLKDSHANLFVNLSKNDYQTAFDATYADLFEPGSLLEAHITFQQFVALGKIGHARIDFPDAHYDRYRDEGGKAFPIYIKFSGDDWLVSDNYSRQQLPEGTQITHIDGRSVGDWMTEIQSHISSESVGITRSLLEFQLPQYLWLVTMPEQFPETFSLSVLVNGEHKEVTVNNIAREEIFARINSTEESETESAALRDYRILSGDVAYIRPGPFYNAEDPSDVWNNSNFIEFVNEAFESFLANGVKQLIVDLRNNPGGTNSFSDPLIAWFADKPFRFASKFLVRSSFYAEQSNAARLKPGVSDANDVSVQLAQAYKKNPHGTVFEFSVQDAKPRKDKQFEGEVFVLVDRTSYSNAVSLAAIVQDYGFGEVIGESTQDYATTYASMEFFTLAESGIKVGFPKAHIIRPSGDLVAGPVVVDAPLAGHKLENLIRSLDSE